MDFGYGMFCVSNLIKATYQTLFTHGYGSAKSVIYDILGYGGRRRLYRLVCRQKNVELYFRSTAE